MIQKFRSVDSLKLVRALNERLWGAGFTGNLKISMIEYYLTALVTHNTVNFQLYFAGLFLGAPTCHQPKKTKVTTNIAEATTNFTIRTK